MTAELLLVSVTVGLFGGWLVGIVAGKGQCGLLGDLALGLFGGCIAVWFYQAGEMEVYAGIVGGVLAALIGAVGVVLARRQLAHLHA